MIISIITTDLILSKASPQTHLTEFFSVAFFPISPKCLLQTSTTSGSSSYQSTKLNFLEIHSLATPPSPPPMIAALSLSLFNLNLHQQKLSYKDVHLKQLLVFLHQ